jgi:hypothetical protein
VTFAPGSSPSRASADFRSMAVGATSTCLYERATT